MLKDFILEITKNRIEIWDTHAEAGNLWPGQGMITSLNKKSSLRGKRKAPSSF